MTENISAAFANGTYLDAIQILEDAETNARDGIGDEPEAFFEGIEYAIHTLKVYAGWHKEEHWYGSTKKGQDND